MLYLLLLKFALHLSPQVKGKAAIDVVCNPLGKSGGALIQQFMILTFGSLANSTPNNIREKKPTPVKSRTVGVIVAATPHPYLSNINWLTSIIVNVAIPVAVEKSPIKEEYSLGLGNCSLYKFVSKKRCTVK